MSYVPKLLLSATNMWHYYASFYVIFVTLRSSRSQILFKTGVLKNFTKLTGKHLCQSLSFNKVVGFRPEIFRNTFFYRTPLVAASVL